MSQQTFNAKISQILPEKVMVEGNRLEKPDPNSKKYHDGYFEVFNLNKYNDDLLLHEASAFEAEVENVFQLKDVKVENGIIMTPTAVVIDQIIHAICIGQSCKVVFTGEGKVKIVELLKINRDEANKI